MLLLALALAAQGQWTGPRTEEYQGPGYFCGGGYAIHPDQTDFALRLTSDAFRGFKQDGWFFGRANFSSDAEKRVPCLAAVSY